MAEDLNSDGYVDIIASNKLRIVNGINVASPFYLNDGSGRFIEVPISLLNDPTWFGAYSTELFVFDANGDGRIDVINTSVGFTRVYLQQDPGATITGTSSADGLMGDASSETILALAGNDVIFAGAGDDVITGGAGADYINGGVGLDTAVYSGAAGSYTWARQSDGTWKVTDSRAGAPDGVDTLVNIERLRFTDQTVTLAPVLSAPVESAFSNILRGASSVASNLALGSDLSFRTTGGATTNAGAISELVSAADTTTSVATLAYQFFTGHIPGGPGYDYLVSPTGPNANNLNSAYYQSFNLENRYINFAVNLGKLGEGKDAFAASYGSMSLFDATKAAYTRIFGGAPTDAKVHALLDPTFNFNGQTITRADYFGFYGLDGPNGIGPKAAMVGWLMAEAEKADIGMYARANAAFLADLADGATFGIDLVGVYGRPEYAFGGVNVVFWQATGHLGCFASGTKDRQLRMSTEVQCRRSNVHA